MDILAHTLVAVAISRVGFKNRVPYATTALVVAANLPDLDILYGWSGASYLAHHRGLTHSLLFWPIWTVLVAVALRWMVARRPRIWGRRVAEPQVVRLAVGAESGSSQSAYPESDLPRGVFSRSPLLPPWRWCLLLGAVGVGSHLLLDLSNAYGVRLLAPFSQRWFAWDLVPNLDPWIWVLLLTFLLAPMVLGLVGREIGARRNPHRLSAALALALLAGWWGVRYVFHGRATALLDAHIFSTEAPLRVAALPYSGTPELWYAVVDLPDRYQLATVDGSTPRLEDAMARQTIFKPLSSPAVQLAESTPAGQAFLHFARFPIALTTREADGGSRILITDLRFKPAGEEPRMGVVVHLDRELRVTSSRFTWTGASPPEP